jgi:hypothetical protein
MVLLRMAVMKQITGTVVSSRSLSDEWDEDACLCQGKVPDDKRIDVQQRIFDEKRNQHRWKSFVRYHQDCPVHGCNRKEPA